MTLSYSKIFDSLNGFIGSDLNVRIGELEADVQNIGSRQIRSFLTKKDITSHVLSNASAYKAALGQINTTIHALGILKCLPHILEDDEVVEYVSLGAGNMGRDWDLETNRRIAEFKFINWKGNDAYRQNSIFKDFFELETSSQSKDKFLYSLGTAEALKFFNGGRAISSITNGSKKIATAFYAMYGEKYTTVGPYFKDRRHEVNIVDVSNWVPELIN